MTALGVIKSLLSTGHEPFDRGGPINRRFPNHFETAAPGNDSATDIQYSASTVSILQFGISSPKLSEQQVFDIALNQIRVRADQCAGSQHSLSIRWKTKSGFGRSRSQGVGSQTPRRIRCRHCHQ